MNGLIGKAVNVLGSRQFYWAVIAFFIFEGLWIAFSAKYPMAFDEDFHFGVIKIYSQQWLPFLSGQPEGGNAFGALAADPSYLYHYLMSFPYRLIALFTDSQAAQVILLRLINISMIVGGVVLFRKVFIQAGSSPLLVNVATFIFVLIPTVPLLAGQINYDNLMLLSLAWVCWLVLGITQDLAKRKIDLQKFGWLAAALLLSSLVKYPFLPLALVALVYVAVMVWRTFPGRRMWTPFKRSYANISKNTKIGLLTLLVISAGLFIQRYIANVVSYSDPMPDCAKVLTVEDCMEYGPWARNYSYAADKVDANPNPIAYTWLWLQGLHYRLFFMITGPPKHTNYPPAILPSAIAVVIFLFSVGALLFYGRQAVKGQPFLGYLLALVVIYAASLWLLQNYAQYLQTGRPVAINGRYFIPLLLPLAAVCGRALGVALRRWPMVKNWAIVAVALLFLQGGGVMSFILRSDESWYWPNSSVVAVNKAAQKILTPIVFIGPKQY